MQRCALVVLFGLGLAFFALALSAGALRSLRIDGRLPSVDGAYGPFIQDLIERDAGETALRQFRVAATLDFENRRRLLPYAAALAREQGDAEAEVWALRELTRLTPSDAGLRRRLEEAEATRR